MLLDSNIIIYAVKPGYDQVRTFVKQHSVSASAISQVEALGYHDLGKAESQKLTRLFGLLTVVPVTDSVIQRSIDLRQQRAGMTTVDAIIAATALISGNALATHDTTDFGWIDELDVIDPV